MNVHINPLTSEKCPKVSPTHWSNLAHLNAKVPKPVGTPNGVKISSFEGDLMNVHINPSTKSLGLQSDPSKGIDKPHKDSPSSAGKIWSMDFQSKAAINSRSSKHISSVGSRPASLGSTAGHTPFKSRLASLAKELRNRKHGQSSKLEHSGVIPSNEDAISSSVPHHCHDGPIGTYRPKPHLLQQNRSQTISGLHTRPLSTEYYGEEDDLLGDGMEPIEKGEPQLHMEMPNYLMTRKKLMEEHQLEYVSAKEKPMLELENQGREMSSATATQGGEIICNTKKRNLEEKEDLGHVGLGVDTNI